MSMSDAMSTVPVMEYHPWRALRSFGDRVRVIWAPLPENTMGLTDGSRHIWINCDLSQAERRSTLAHELAHIELGHTEGCNPHDERRAIDLAVRRLIPMPHLLDALRWSEELEEVAETLHVDMDTLTARLDGLTDAERGQIVGLYFEMERGA